MRIALGLLLGSVPLGIAHGWFVRWFDPCIGASRYEPCANDDSYRSVLQPCVWRACDFSPTTLESIIRLAIVVTSCVLAGLIAAFIARRAHLLTGAVSALLMAGVGACAFDYFYPYRRLGSYSYSYSTEQLGYDLIGGVILSLIGVIGGWLARKLTNSPAATHS